MALSLARGRALRRAALLAAALASSACAASVVPLPALDDAAIAVDANAGPDVRPPGADGSARDGTALDVTGDGGRPDCPGTEVRCSGVCTDTSINPFHCGACATRCRAGDECTAGVCSTPCAMGQRRCDSSGGCVPVLTDPANCGACGHRCPAGISCVAGACHCAGVRGGVCAGACVDLNSDASNCGACGVVCPAGRTCLNSRCNCPGSPGAVCAGACADLATDPRNCGACGHSCAATESCRSGRCRSSSVTSYRLESAGGAPWVEACDAPGATTLLPNTDDGSALVPLPFALRFWDSTLAAGAPVNVCTNGWLGLDGMPNNALAGTLPSGLRGPFSVVAVHWTDAFTRAPGICVATTGAAPARSFVVEWRDAYYCCGAHPDVRLTFEAVLHEGTGVIELAYQDMRGSRPATTGVGNPFGDDAVTACPGGTCMPVAGTVYRFTPVP